MASDYIIRPLGVVAGFIYPFYSSFKSLDTKSTESSSQWLTYWTVLSVIGVFEYFFSWALPWIPLYFTLKLAFILWLQLPQTKGATIIYWRLIHPQLKKHEAQIDGAVNASSKRMMRMREQFTSNAAQSEHYHRGITSTESGNLRARAGSSTSLGLPTTMMTRTSTAADKVLQELEAGDAGEKGE